jgi:hypothetical protein
VLTCEEQDAAEDGVVLGLPQVVAFGTTTQLEPVAFKVQIAGQRSQVDQASARTSAPK